MPETFRSREAIFNAIQVDEQRTNADASMSDFLDPKTLITEGSFIGRTLDQYEDILCHSGAPSLTEFAMGLPSEATIVDSGCGACLYLAGLRERGVQAELVGIDTRDIRRNQLVENGKMTPVEQLLKKHRISFIRGSQLNIRRYVPEKYNLLTNVAAFPEEENIEALQIPLLEAFYRGLAIGGRAYVFARMRPEVKNAVETHFQKLKIPIQFFPFLHTSKHGLSATQKPEDGFIGTVYLGPKVPAEPVLQS